MRALNSEQERVLRYLNKYRRTHGEYPEPKTIACRFGIRWRTALHHLEALTMRGLLAEHKPMLAEHKHAAVEPVRAVEVLTVKPTKQIKIADTRVLRKRESQFTTTQIATALASLSKGDYLAVIERAAALRAMRGAA